MPGVRLTDILTTTDVPHEVVDYGGSRFFFARLPEGDFAIHEKRRGDCNGYAGDAIDFLISDGTIETVVGPYSCAGLFDHGIAEKLSTHLGRPELNAKATRLVIGRNLSDYCGKPKEIVFEENAFSLGDWRDRIRDEWRIPSKGLQAAIHTRSGIRYSNLQS